MNFTREPIIETIITPKEGCKLAVRSSKSEGQEEYLVDAVEVVSFGQALFFRSTEKPKPFLLPVGDYEVTETKESRVVLKNAQFERTIKIGGGREAPIRRESQERDEEEESIGEEGEEGQGSYDAQFDRKRGGQDRRRNRRRRASEERDEMRARLAPPAAVPQEAEEQDAPQKEMASTPFQLIPPPPTLVNVEHYKNMFTSQETSEPTGEPKDKPEIKDESEGSKELNRVAVETFEVESVQTHFSNLNDWTNFLS